MLLIDEHIRPDGAVVKTFLQAVAPDRVRLVGDDGVHGELSSAAVEKVMTRYGRDLELGVVAPGGEALALDCGSLSMLHFKAVVDAEGRHYLVWQAPGAAPIAALSNGVAAALRYLVLRIAEERTKAEPGT